MHKASIIIPLLNQREDWLKQSIDSALKQTVPVEVIIVRSKNTNESNRKVLDSYQGIRVLEEEKPNYASGFNTGFFNASTDRLGILFTDDWIEPTAVEECLKYDTDIVSTGLALKDTEGRTFRLSIPSIQKFHVSPIYEQASQLKHFLLFKKERILEIGGVDDSIGRVGPDDYDMVWVLLERNATVGIVGRPLYNYRDHEESRITLTDKEKMVADFVKILDKHKITGELREQIIASKSRFFGKRIQDVRK